MTFAISIASGNTPDENEKLEMYGKSKTTARIMYFIKVMFII